RWKRGTLAAASANTVLRAPGWKHTPVLAVQLALAESSTRTGSSLLVTEVSPGAQSLSFALPGPAHAALAHARLPTIRIRPVEVMLPSFPPRPASVQQGASHWIFCLTSAEGANLLGEESDKIRHRAHLTPQLVHTGCRETCAIGATAARGGEPGRSR